MEEAINQYIKMTKYVGISIATIVILAIIISIIIIVKRKKKIKCINCYKEIDKDSTYCKWCGTKQ